LRLEIMRLVDQHRIVLSARNIVPHPGVVFEAILQPFGETQLASCIEAGGAEGGDQGGDGVSGYVGREEQDMKPHRRYFDSGTFGSLIRSPPLITGL